jgi:tetratricopeptide (TPR) repeat protein
MGLARALPAALLGLAAAAVAVEGGVRPPAAAGLQLAAAGLAACAALAPGLRGVPGPALALAALWSGLALAQLAWAVDLDAALDGAAGALAAAALFLVSVAALPARGRSRWLAGFTALGVAVALLAVVRAEPGMRAAFPLGNPNHLAAWLLLPAGIAFAALFLPGGGRAHPLWFGALLVIAAGMAVSGSRGAALAAAVAAGAVWSLRRASAPRALALATAGLAAGGIALSLVPALAPEVGRVEGAGAAHSAGLRWQVYAASARALLDAAPLGTGLGGFSAAFDAHRPAELPYAPRYAHNELLHGGVELGLPFAAALVASGWLVARGLRAPLGEPRERLARAGGGAALLALAAHALIDFAPHVPAVALAAACVAGCSLAGAQGPARAGRTRVLLAGIASALVAIAGSGWIALASEARAQERLAAGEFAGAEVAARAGLRVRPARVALLRAVAHAAEQGAELADGGDAARGRALAARARAAALSPRRADLQLELGESQARAGDFGAALAAFARAADLDPASPAPHVSRARLLVALHRGDEAAAAVRAALERRPLAAFAAAEALLRATDAPELARAAVPEQPRAVAAAGQALARAGYARDAALAFAHASDLAPRDPRAALDAAQSLRSAGEPERAIDLLAAALARMPGDERLRRELARLEALRERQARRRDAGPERAT